MITSSSQKELTGTHNIKERSSKKQYIIHSNLSSERVLDSCKGDVSLVDQPNYGHYQAADSFEDFLKTNNNYFDFSVNHLFEERESQILRGATDKTDSGLESQSRFYIGDSPTHRLSFAQNRDEIIE